MSELETTVQDIKFTVNNQSVIGSLFCPSKPNGHGLLFFHGWGSSRAGYVDRASAICNLGYHCLVIDIRGFGESDGDYTKLSNADHVADTIAAYDFLKNTAQVNKISVCETSMGGYLCAMLSVQRDLKSIVMRAPAIYPNDIFNSYDYTNEEQLLNEIYRVKTDADFAQTDAIKNIAKYSGSILVIGSHTDEKIPPIILESYYKHSTSASKRELIWMPGASHSMTNPEHRKQYIEIIADWFSKLA